VSLFNVRAYWAGGRVVNTLNLNSAGQIIEQMSQFIGSHNTLLPLLLICFFWDFELGYVNQKDEFVKPAGSTVECCIIENKSCVHAKVLFFQMQNVQILIFVEESEIKKDIFDSTAVIHPLPG